MAIKTRICMSTRGTITFLLGKNSRSCSVSGVKYHLVQFRTLLGWSLALLRFASQVTVRGRHHVGLIRCSIHHFDLICDRASVSSTAWFRAINTMAQDVTDDWWGVDVFNFLHLLSVVLVQQAVAASSRLQFSCPTSSLQIWHFSIASAPLRKI